MGGPVVLPLRLSCDSVVMAGGLNPGYSSAPWLLLVWSYPRRSTPGKDANLPSYRQDARVT